MKKKEEWILILKRKKIILCVLGELCGDFF